MSKSSDRAPRKAPVLRVLVVDDSDVNRAILERILSRWGVEVAEARDGLRAVELTCTNDTPFDLVFMDLFMPVMDGATATTLIRRFEQEHTKGRVIPVVAYTPSPADDLQALAATGFNAELKKPSRPEHIWKCLRTWCSGRLDALGLTGPQEIEVDDVSS